MLMWPHDHCFDGDGTFALMSTPWRKRRQALARRLLIPRVARLIGFRVVEVSAGEAKGELRAGIRHAGPGGTVHGGILCDLADATMGIAFMSTLHGCQSATTTELKINFLRPVWKGRLVAVARVVHRGRRLGLVECEVCDKIGRLIAKASSTCMVLAQPLAPRRLVPRSGSAGHGRPVGRRTRLLFNR